MKLSVLIIGHVRLDCIKHQMDVLQRNYDKFNEIWLVLDGPRSDTDKLKQEQIMSLVNERGIFTNIFVSEINRGCRDGPAWAIEKFLSVVNEGVILEDDCIASDDFFDFASLQLNRFRDDSTVMHIGGNTYGYRGDAGVLQSRYAQVWGWATWRSKWVAQDDNLPEIYFQLIKSSFNGDTLARLNKARHVRKVECGKLDAWDAVWHANVMLGGKCVFPSYNMITNIGGDSDATHTQNATNLNIQHGRGSLSFLDSQIDNEFLQIQRNNMGLNRIIGLIEYFIAIWFLLRTKLKGI